MVEKSKIIFRNHQAPGDLVMLSAAIRDLHKSYPGRFRTEVQTSCEAIWLNNPYITNFRVNEKFVQRVNCQYPLINQSNQLPYHFIHAFIHFINDKLGLNIRPTAFKGDIHLSDEEKNNEVFLDKLGITGPFWLMAAGGKRDFTIKWWETQRYQEVVNHFKGKINFVQIGAKEHHHPPLDNVVNLVGRTSIRDLILLMYHAQGVVTPVSLLMHLAAAVETKTGMPELRPCVVIAGGREPVHWEAYPGHQFIHTIGALPCCATGGCWKSRTKPLDDGSKNDNKENLCVDVAGSLPRCMDMISSQEVVRRIETYFEGGIVEYISQKTGLTENIGIKDVTKTRRQIRPVVPEHLTEQTSLGHLNAYLETIPEYPNSYSGKGIVICGGGAKYFPGIWVLVNMLRFHGCELPIEVWYLGGAEMDGRMKEILQPFNVQCIDGLKVREEKPCRILKGWELKAFSLLHSSFEEVLLLDADNVPVINPEELFEWPEYKKTGAVLWPDVGKLSKGRHIWELTGVPYREEPEVESGQILVNKRKCWKALNVSLWLNEYSDFFYQYIHGDKETFHIGFRKAETEYSMTPHHVVLRQGVMYQHDFRGKVVFQHRNGHKWNLDNNKNPALRVFQYEDVCMAFIDVLRNLWDGQISRYLKVLDTKENSTTVEDELVSKLWYYERVGHDRRPMVFLPEGKIGRGSDTCEKTWKIEQNGKGKVLFISGEEGLICTLRPKSKSDLWEGNWLKFEQMPVNLIAINANAVQQ